LDRSRLSARSAVVAMPSILKVRIVAAKDLPVMDRKSMLADPFVTVSHSGRGGRAG